MRRKGFELHVVLSLSVALWGCTKSKSADSKTAPSASRQDSSPLTLSASARKGGPPAAAARELKAGPLGVSGHRIKLSGADEIAVSADAMHCGNKALRTGGDAPDAPATAFRRADGKVVMLAVSKPNWFFEGTTLDNVTRASCKGLLEATPDPDPSVFRGHRWLFAAYTVENGPTIGFVHNEYHGDEYHKGGDCIVTDKSSYQCWYVSVTTVLSRDGGMTFDGKAPPGILAAPGTKFATGRKRIGYAHPIVVGDPAGEFIYAIVGYVNRNDGTKGRSCLLRASTKNVSEWRGWDGTGFNAVFGNPYLKERGDTPCTAVFDFALTGVKYVPKIGSYVGIGVQGTGVYYAFSKDLISWDAPQLLREYQPHSSWKPGAVAPEAYFTFLDPTSKSRNFDTLEDRPYVYFSRFRLMGGKYQNARRDIVRVPITIQ